jgi:hypothetical protein
VRAREENRTPDLRITSLVHGERTYEDGQETPGSPRGRTFMTDPERARPREGRAMDERSAVCLLASLVAEREHPAEGAEDRLLAPAAGGAATFDGAHLLDESAYDGEQEIETQCPTDRLGHAVRLVCCRGDGPSSTSTVWS